MHIKFVKTAFKFAKTALLFAFWDWVSKLAKRALAFGDRHFPK